MVCQNMVKMGVIFAWVMAFICCSTGQSAQQGTPLLRGTTAGYKLNLQWEGIAPADVVRWELQVAGRLGGFRHYKTFAPDQQRYSGRIVPGRWTYRIRAILRGGALSNWSNHLSFVVDRQIHAATQPRAGTVALQRCENPPPLPQRELQLIKQSPANQVPLASRQVPRANGLAQSTIDTILNGYKWGITTVTYSFYSDAQFGGAYYGSETVSEVSDGIKARVRQVFDIISKQVNLNFVEVTEDASSTTQPYGHIRIMLSDGPSYAYAYYPTTDTLASVAGDVHLSPSYDNTSNTNGFQNGPGSHGFTALIHEIGHALGLKHPHEGTPTLDSSEDNLGNTVMTYNFTGSECASYVRYDVAALAYLYGNKSNETGNSTYTLGSAEYVYTLNSTTYFSSPYSSFHQMIYDTGGTDTINLAAVTSGDLRIDLESGGYICRKSEYVSSTDIRSGICTAYDNPVEILITSPGDDDIYSGSQANTFVGYGAGYTAGQDVLYNADSSDVIDLTNMLPSSMTFQRNSNDLVLSYSSNQITIKNYYSLSSPATPVITYSTTDTAAPSAPGSVSAVQSGSSVIVSWTAASDDVQVLTYIIKRDGTTVGYVSGSELTFTDTGITNAQTYTYTVQARDASLNVSGDATTTITTNAPPTAVISANPTSGHIPVTVSFDASASTDSNGTITAYAWNFGDGNSGSGVTATHTYSTAGTYTVTLTVTDNEGATDSTTVTITAEPPNVAPTASFSTNTTSGNLPLAISFDASASTDSDGTISAYVWDFGDGATGSGVTTSHTYTYPGTYTVTLVVTDDDGATDTATTTITAVDSDPSPTAVISVNAAAGNPPFTLQADGSSSWDSETAIATYVWDFGDGNSATGATVTHTYANSGTYTLSLTVTDGDGLTDTTTTSIRVNTAPYANISASPGLSGTAPLTITFDASASSDTDGSISSYSWDFGDGNSASGASASHTYSTPGSYTVTLTIVDNESLSSTKTVAVTVSAPPSSGGGGGGGGGGCDIAPNTSPLSSWLLLMTLLTLGVIVHRRILSAN